MWQAYFWSKCFQAKVLAFTDNLMSTLNCAYNGFALLNKTKLYLIFHGQALSASADTKTLLERVKTQSSELQEVKRQLTSVLCELSNAEEELLRLRQRKVDVSSLEKQV